MSSPLKNLGWDPASPSVITYTPFEVLAATAAALPANTAAGAGVGATLTMDAVGILTVDGVALVLNDRLFVLPAHAGANDRAGIYAMTTEGDAGTAAILTRATDFDQAAAGEIALGAAIRPTAGTANVGKTYVLTTSAAITVDTTALAFTEYASGVAVATRYSEPLSLWPGITLVGIIVVIDSTTALAGSLSFEVVNATKQELDREDAGLITLPWKTIQPIDDLEGTLTVSNGVITISGGDINVPVSLANLAFGWLRVKWAGTLGVGTIALRVCTKDV